MNCARCEECGKLFNVEFIEEPRTGFSLHFCSTKCKAAHVKWLEEMGMSFFLMENEHGGKTNS